MKASRKLLLASAALIAPLMAASAASAADLPLLASPDSWGGWYVDHSSMEFGGQVFIEKPGTGPNSTSNNTAKFNEYGNRTDPLFLNFIDLGLATKDGHYTADIRGKNIGTNDQDLELDLAQPGEQYLTLGWYQTPILRSTTAQTIFNGSGNNLTVPDSVVQALYGGISNNGNMYTAGAGITAVTNPFLPASPTNPSTTIKIPAGCYLPGQGVYNSSTNPTGCVAGAQPVATTIANAEHGVTLGLQRDRKEVNYRWTPSPDWDVKIDYSNEHRWGLQEQGFLFSDSTSTPLAQVAAPVDDTTQDASISAEYAGYSPWGMRWNGILRYDASIYTDRYSAFTAENPFGGPGSPVAGVPLCPVASATTTPNCYGEGQEGTPPDNQSNAFSASTGIDLPWFKSSRYMGTFSYNMMTENAAFIPMTINPNGGSNLWPTTNTSTTVALAPMPRGSLGGNIDTTLFNNVLTSQFTSDVKNKLSYRYYSNENNTPAETYTNFIINDTAIATNTVVDGGSLAPHSTIFSSYKKQDASDELTWDPVKWANVGVSSGWERYDYTLYAVDNTNEFTEKVFADLTPTDWLTVRASDAESWRRYGDYNWQAYIGNAIIGAGAGTSLVENPLLADVNVANRDRNLANLFIDVTTPIQGLIITPTANVRWDDYPSDPNLLSQPGTAGGPYQLGLRSDHDWSAGIEANLSINSATSFVASYMHEATIQSLIGNSSATNGPAEPAWYNNLHEGVNTWTLAANLQLIPDRLALKVSGSYVNANDNWGIGPEPTCPVATSSSCGVANAINPAYPPETTSLYQVDAVLTYKVDPAIMTQFGSKGEAFLKLHYLWERSSVTNWQNDMTSVYMYSTLNPSTVSLKDMIFMAGDNPNYNAQALMASLVMKW